jgi:cytochrome b subunit of formate dehydrogenase
MMNRARFIRLLRLGSVLIGLLCMAGVDAAAQKPKAASGGDCSSCHDQAQKLEKSAHAVLTCDTCHEKHEKYPHPAGTVKPKCVTCHDDQAKDYDKGVHGQAVKHGNAGAPDCGMCHGDAHQLIAPKAQTFRAAVPETCGMCHTDVVEQFKASVHGQALAKGVTQAPLCTDCHGEHNIIKHTNEASPVSAGRIRDTCGSCHGDVRLGRKFGMPADRIVSFDASFHGLAAKAGSQTVANCASCHGVHKILASSDPKSTINARNLPHTCGKCHAGAGSRFAISQIHVVEGRGEPLPIQLVRQFYLLVIPVTIGLMLLHNGGDWIRKLIRLRSAKALHTRHAGRPGHGHREMRMLPFERVQHALMATSFIVLVWTGFALKYPDQWWARPLMAGAMRSLTHRVAAVVLMAVSVIHLVSLIVSRQLRHHWLEMLPRVRDMREASSGFAYNIGLGGTPPYRSSHSYIEKAEYWAVIWGTVVMVASGVMLWANNLAMKLLPKLWLDVATSVHFYEAVLATLSIVVWHFYTIIFDPDVYPLDTAFLTGYSVKEHAHPDASASKETAALTGD